MKGRLQAIFLAALLQGHSPAQQAPAGSTARDWSNTEGKKISAEYLGIRGEAVMVRMADGKTVSILLAKLSEQDQAFVRENPLVYQEPWLAWSPEVEKATAIVVTETPSGKGEFVYETNHFRYHVDGNLGAPLMKDLAYVFELTYLLHLKSPFGLLAKPEGDRFEAKLYGSRQAYWAQGGPQMTAGVYLPKKKVFLAPLDLMGVKVTDSVWRRIPRSRCDTTTVIHELTHMLTHEMLITLPTWFNEGYAEYIANIPIEGDVFRISPKKIREGAIESFVQDYEKSRSRSSGFIPKLGPADRSKFLKENLPELPPVSTVLGITDEKWAATPSGEQFAVPGNSSTELRKFSYSQKMGLYRTSHLILYYFLQLDGEKGVSKLRRFVALKQKNSSELIAYKAAFDEYERQMEAFLKLPGVQSLENGQFRYPSNLTPPTAPKLPAADAEAFTNSGMDIIFDGETPEALGLKIQQAVAKDLGLNLDFSMKITPIENPPIGRQIRIGP